MELDKRGETSSNIESADRNAVQDRAIASNFANALDLEDYPAAVALLDEHCIYDSPTGEIVGISKIIASYSGNGDSARDRFGEIKYSHDVTQIDETSFRIQFIDALTHCDRSHTFRCHQLVTIRDGRIARIVHEEIPGEREALNEFLACIA